MFLPEELARGLAATTTPAECLWPPPPRPCSRRGARRHSRRRPGAPGVPAGGHAVRSVDGGVGFKRRGRRTECSFGIVLAIWGFAVGFVGCFLGYAWLFTITSWRTGTRTSCCAPPGPSRSPGSAWASRPAGPAPRARRSRWRRRRARRGGRRGRDQARGGAAPGQHGVDRVLPAGLAGGDRGAGRLRRAGPSR